MQQNDNAAQEIQSTHCSPAWLLTAPFLITAFLTTFNSALMVIIYAVMAQTNITPSISHTTTEFNATTNTTELSITSTPISSNDFLINTAAGTASGTFICGLAFLWWSCFNNKEKNHSFQNKFFDILRRSSWLNPFTTPSATLVIAKFYEEQPIIMVGWIAFCALLSATLSSTFCFTFHALFRASENCKNKNDGESDIDFNNRRDSFNRPVQVVAVEPSRTLEMN